MEEFRPGTRVKCSLNLPSAEWGSRTEAIPPQNGPCPGTCFIAFVLLWLLPEPLLLPAWLSSHSVPRLRSQAQSVREASRCEAIGRGGAWGCLGLLCPMERGSPCSTPGHSCQDKIQVQCSRVAHFPRKIGKLDFHMMRHFLVFKCLASG